MFRICHLVMGTGAFAPSHISDQTFAAPLADGAGPFSREILSQDYQQGLAAFVLPGFLGSGFHSIATTCNCQLGCNGLRAAR